MLFSSCSRDVVIESPQSHPLVVGQQCAMRGYAEGTFGSQSLVDHWESSDVHIATVSYEEGIVEALSPGKTTITAFAKRASESFELEVTDQGYLKNLGSNDTIVLQVGESKSISFVSSNAVSCYSLDNDVCCAPSVTSLSNFIYVYPSIHDGSVSEYQNVMNLIGISSGLTNVRVYNEDVNIDRMIPVKVVE